MLAFFLFFLLTSMFLFVWDLIKKCNPNNENQPATTKIELFQYSCNVVLNAIIAVSLLVFIRFFFYMLKQKMDDLGQGHIKAYASLKCALSTLCGTFFLRCILMLVLVCEIGIRGTD